MKAIDRKLLFHLVDVVWGDIYEDESVPSTFHARELIQKAIERRRAEKYKGFPNDNMADLYNELSKHEPSCECKSPNDCKRLKDCILTMKYGR